jgi:hypothetical protein
MGPLHLEDLEPHRFEDLIRQLLYDFRQWRDLEATGRSGSDDGFDARAWEVFGFPSPIENDEDGNPVESDPLIERQWLIQCKREKAIGPAKLINYLDGLPDPIEANIFGLVFVAACDFSITTRDAFYQRARERGFQEVKLWGKAEVEDQLFQPKNDNLLFAYFGVSLRVRRRSVATQVRSIMTIKRKARKALRPYTNVVVLDATDDRYPYLDPDETLPRELRGRWKVFEVDSVNARGVLLKSRRHFAFIDKDRERWDYAERMNDAIPHTDPWREDGSEFDRRWRWRSEDMTIWDALEAGTKGWFEMQTVLPFDQIIEIDADGDEEPFSGPVIYTQQFRADGKVPLAEYAYFRLSINDWHENAKADEEKRVHVFPRDAPLAEVGIEAGV